LLPRCWGQTAFYSTSLRHVIQCFCAVPRHLLHAERTNASIAISCMQRTNASTAKKKKREEETHLELTNSTSTPSSSAAFLTLRLHLPTERRPSPPLLPATTPSSCACVVLSSDACSPSYSGLPFPFQSASFKFSFGVIICSPPR
jgi:hypothetical protein